MRRPLPFLVASLFAFTVFAGASIMTTSSTSAATTIGPTTSIGSTTLCGNTVDNTPGLGMICEVTVVNTITAAGSTASVTVRECHGAAGAPDAACWTPPTAVLAEQVIAVTLCNGSMWGGGSMLRCSVQITNNFIDGSPGLPIAITQCNDSSWGGGSFLDCSVQITNNFTVFGPGATQIVTQCNDSGWGGGSTLDCGVDVTNTFPGASPGGADATVNQCNASGDGFTDNCDPEPATPVNATIVQCNGSANGGTLVGLTCTAGGASAQSVLVVQCNLSVNGGGSTVICDANLPDDGPVPPPSPSASVEPSPSASVAPSPSASVEPILTPAPIAAPTPTPPIGTTATQPPTATETPPSLITVTTVASSKPRLPETSTIDPHTEQRLTSGPLVLGVLAFLVALSLMAAFGQPIDPRDT